MLMEPAPGASSFDRNKIRHKRRTGEKFDIPEVLARGVHDTVFYLRGVKDYISGFQRDRLAFDPRCSLALEDHDDRFAGIMIVVGGFCPGRCRRHNSKNSIESLGALLIGG